MLNRRKRFVGFRQAPPREDHSGALQGARLRQERNFSSGMRFDDNATFQERLHLTGAQTVERRYPKFPTLLRAFQDNFVTCRAVGIQIVDDQHVGITLVTNEEAFLKAKRNGDDIEIIHAMFVDM